LGRIVALFAFSGALTVQCIQKEMPLLVEQVVDWTVTYTDGHFMSWIVQNGDWVCFFHFCCSLHPLFNICINCWFELFVWALAVSKNGSSVSRPNVVKAHNPRFVGFVYFCRGQFLCFILFVCFFYCQDRCNSLTTETCFSK